jgi:hypothetical protein
LNELERIRIEAMATLTETAVNLLAKVKALEEKLSVRLTDLQKESEKLAKAGLKVEKSWSGSALGYHSELHYGDFEAPAPGARFSPEWGGMNGLPPGWWSRTPDEVKERIEQLAGTACANLEEDTAAVLAEVKAFQLETVTEVSALHAKAGLEHEKKLLAELENFKWGKTVNDYMSANLNTGFMSRDSLAISQGVRVPAHLYYVAVAFQSDEQCKAVREFLGLSTRLLRQIELNATSVEMDSGADAHPVKAVLAICERFHEVARQLTHRRESRATLEIKDEYDVQDLLHALLHIHFDDIRPEEWTPSYGGGSSRMDFLLKDHAIVVEAKMTRKGLAAKEVSEQLMIDAAKYREHQDCKTLVCLVYDPSDLVKNPRGIERDLSKLSRNGLEVICLIVPFEGDAFGGRDDPVIRRV